ncbi:unnamed protein product [Rhizoctonia solani]|uniref:MACPF-like domain-containing protein n=1 Tax=Rhizoctonia solani TaxID=456999 RepID=A0A8H2XY06_9AGAM|nr:unnamed protein product [Rhizoctonia solani]
MFDPNVLVQEQKHQALGSFPFLTGVFLDPVTGPFTLSRPVAVFKHTDTDKSVEINECTTEDIYSHNELDAHYAQLGWPARHGLPSKPGDIASPCENQSALRSDVWASRRFMVQRVSINLSPEDLRPVEPFIDAIEEALRQDTIAYQIRALQKVFATWGELIPLNMVAGASLAVTGILSDGRALPDRILPPKYLLRRPSA